MIYSRFGTELTPVSKEQDASGRISIQVPVEGGTELRDYAIADLKADDGTSEINKAISKLPWRVAELKSQPREQKFR